MRYSGEIKGIWHNVKHGVSKTHKFAIEYTANEIGKSLSIGNLDTGDMYQIPFDALYKMITGGDRKWMI